VEYSTPFQWNGAAYSTEWNVRSSGMEQGGMVASMLPGEWNGAISKLSGAILESGMEGRKLCGAMSIRAVLARIDIAYWRGIEITALTSR
jgi:hypothetical protein